MNKVNIIRGKVTGLRVPNFRVAECFRQGGGSEKFPCGQIGCNRCITRKDVTIRLSLFVISTAAYTSYICIALFSNTIVITPALNRDCSYSYRCWLALVYGIGENICRISA